MGRPHKSSVDPPPTMYSNMLGMAGDERHYFWQLMKQRNLTMDAVAFPVDFQPSAIDRPRLGLRKTTHVVPQIGMMVRIRRGVFHRAVEGRIVARPGDSDF